MGFDLFQSRRNYNEFCKWWSRDEREQFDSDELMLRRIPSGTFYAKQLTSSNYRDINIANTFMFDGTTVSIKTPDNIEGIKNRDIVLFQNEFWNVETVQKEKARVQNTNFCNDNVCSHYWYLELRK